MCLKKYSFLLDKTTYYCILFYYIRLYYKSRRILQLHPLFDHHKVIKELQTLQLSRKKEVEDLQKRRNQETTSCRKSQETGSLTGNQQSKSIEGTSFEPGTELPFIFWYCNIYVEFIGKYGFKDGFYIVYNSGDYQQN